MMEQNNNFGNNQNQRNDNQSKQILLSVLAVAILVVAVVGVSFAAFTYVGIGTKENVISTGTISMEYTEDTNAISITNAMPVSDEVGKVLTAGPDAGSPAGNITQGLFDFTVKAEIAGTTTINYEVAAVKQDNEGMTGGGTTEPSGGTEIENQIDGQYVKFYLEKEEEGGDSYTAVDDVKTYDSESLVKDSPTSIGSPVGSLVLARGSFTSIGTPRGFFTATGTHKYRLRMWLSDQYVVKNTAEKFVARINVYGKAA